MDGLRGGAAIAVLLYHLQDAGLARLAPRGYLAVDLFFLMSGFVIARAYEHRLLGGWTVRQFLLVRLRRLYPLHLLGSMLGAGALLAAAVLNRDWSFAVLVVLVAASSVAFVPLLRADPTASAFPLLPAAWSLFWELAINVVFALTVRRLSNRVLFAVVLAAGGALLAQCLAANSANLGSTAGDFLLGALRVGLSFPLGILLHRACRAGDLSRLSSNYAWLPLAALAVPVALPAQGPWIGLTDFLVIVGVFPLLITAAALGPVGVKASAVCTKLGAISFPLYALHGPVIALGLFGADLLDLTAGSVVVVSAVAASLLIGLCLIPNRVLTGAGLRPDAPRALSS